MKHGGDFLLTVQNKIHTDSLNALLESSDATWDQDMVTCLKSYRTKCSYNF